MKRQKGQGRVVEEKSRAKATAIALRPRNEKRQRKMASYLPRDEYAYFISHKNIVDSEVLQDHNARADRIYLNFHKRSDIKKNLQHQTILTLHFRMDHTISTRFKILT